MYFINKLPLGRLLVDFSTSPGVPGVPGVAILIVGSPSNTV